MILCYRSCDSFSAMLQVMWYSPANHQLTLNDKLKTFDAKYSISVPYPNEYMLGISKLTLADEGVYTCRITTKPVTAKTVQLIIDC